MKNIRAELKREKLRLRIKKISFKRQSKTRTRLVRIFQNWRSSTKMPRFRSKKKRRS